MKRARQARNLKVRELGRLIDVPPQNISNWESGKRIPKIEELATILGALRVEPTERARLFNLARYATEPNWLDQHALDGSARLATYIEYERAATSMFIWAAALVPGLLQTPEYARAIFAATEAPKPEIENRVMIRLARREILSGRNAPECQALVSEAVLHQNIGGPAVMADQLRYLCSRMRLPNVSVRVVRNGIGYHPGHFGPFIVFDYADLPSLVYLEHHRSSGYVQDQHDVAGYRAATATLSSLAMSEQDSHQLIQEVITGLEA